MSQQVTLPNGGIAEFPDSMSRETITAMIRKQFPPKAAAPPESVLTKVLRGGALGGFQGLGIKPSTDSGEVITGTAKQFGGGIKDLLTDVYKRNVKSPWLLPEQAPFAALDIIPTFLDRTATSLEQGIKDTRQAIQDKDWERASENATQMLTQIAMLRAPSRALKGGEFETIGTARKAGRDFLQKSTGPKEIPIAGEKVPVLKGEADPASWWGTKQEALKKYGISQRRFDAFAQQQMKKVKDVIRKTAQQTSGAIGPMPEEPSAAVGFATDATFAKARPIYQALDEALVSVPDSMGEVSKVMEQAIARARKLGVNVEQGAGESVVINGRKITPSTDPVGWKNLQDQGIVPKTSGQPLETYGKIRSELLKMQRGASDAAQRYAIGNEIKWMNDNIEAAMKNTPLWDDWNEANRLWSKGYALRDVADTLAKKTSGTPTLFQHPELSNVPTEVQGSLVERLNDLQRDGILDRAFTPQEVKNLRYAVDIIDRASGKAGTELKVGYNPHSTVWRWLQQIPFLPAVHAMTKLEGVRALNNGILARNPSQAMQAMDRFARIAGVGGIVSEQKKPSVPIIQRVIKDALIGSKP